MLAGDESSDDEPLISYVNARETAVNYSTSIDTFVRKLEIRFASALGISRSRAPDYL